MDEKQAIQRVKKRNPDPNALVWLVEHYQLRILRTAYLITHERRQAEDVVQQLFLDLPDLLQSFDLARPLEPWLMRVAVNRTLRALSEDSHLAELPERDETEAWLDQWLESTPGPEDAVQQSELTEVIWTGMQLLRPEQRAAVVMRYYLQMSEQEMSGLLAVPKGTIKWRLSAARSQLRKLFVHDPRKDVE